MFTIRTRYACVLSFLLGTFAVSARGEVMPEGVEGTATDTVLTKLSALAKPAPRRGNTVNPFNYSVQGRYLPKGEDFLSDSLKWYSHMGVNVFSGFTFHGSPRSVGSINLSRADVGYPIGASISYQFNRLHGVRLMYVNNRYNHNDRTHGLLKTHELGVGYMFNLTNYFKGYNPQKRMTVFATATAFGTMQKDKEKREMGARGELGLLFNYRLWRQLSLFAEPYFGMSTDDYDRVYTPHRYDWLAGVRAGIATDGSTVEAFVKHIKANKTDLWQPHSWFQHFYFGSSYGRMWTNGSNLPGTKRNWVDSHIFLGYRFTPVQSLRAQATYYKNPEGLERKHHVMGEIDYLINFTNMWRGYHPERRFRVSGLVGVGARYLEKNGGTFRGGEDKVAPFVTAGFDFNYYLTKQISLFIEPYVAGAFPFADASKKTIYGGARGGFQVDLIDTYTYMPHYAFTDEEQEVAVMWQRRPMSHFFFGTSGGIRGVHVWPGENYRAMPVNVFLGYRFTPVQSLRLQASYIRGWENIRHSRHMAGEIDYMVNFTNLLYGYTPRRVNFIGYVGTGTRWVAERGTPGKQALMFTAGGDLMYKIREGLSIYIEPYANLVHQRQQRYYIFDYGVNGGIAVNLDDANLYGERVGGEPTASWENRFWRHLFVGGSGGMRGVHKHGFANEKTYPMNMFFGYRFSPNQAVRLRGSYVKTFEHMDRKYHMEGEADYMLNLTNAFAPYKSNRMFNIIGFAGIGAKFLPQNFEDNRKGKLSPMATMGLDLAMRIKRGLSVFAEPYLAISKGKDQGAFTHMYGANLGLALNMEEVYAYNPRWGTPSAEWDIKPAQRLFFGGSAGYLRTQKVPDKDAIPISVFAGYRFSPIHALRLKFTMAGSRVEGHSHEYFQGGVDYMFNATNLICGYDPHRRFNFIGFVGLGTRDVNASHKVTNDTKFRLMGNAGMDIAYRLSRNINLFVEPYVGAVHSTLSTDFVNYFMGVNGGVVVNLENINQPYGSELVNLNHRPFFEAAYGWVFPFSTGGSTNNSGLNIDLRAGTWIDPIFGARASFVAENYGYSRHYHTQTAKDNDAWTGYASALVFKMRFEGLFNPLNLSETWRENADSKKFEINLAAGVEFGGVGKKYAVGKDQDKYAAYGVTLAMQALYKFSYNTAVFIEPRFEHISPFHTHSNSYRYGDHKKDKVILVNAGVRVQRGTKEQRDDERRLNFEQSIFLGLNAGGYKAVATYKVKDGGRLGFFGGLDFGFLLTPLHGVKLNIQPSWYRARVHELGDTKKFTLMDYRLTYMVNMSNLYQSAARRKIDVYAQAGGVLTSIIRHKDVSLSQSRYAGNANKRGFGLTAGFLVCYNLNRSWAITTEPMANFMFKKGFMPGYAVKPKMGRVRADLSIGTMWKF